MILLGIDTTGESMSVALAEGERLLCEVFTDNGKKHSQTLMPALEQVLRFGGMAVDDTDALAVTVGPGSFTGIRIGVAAAAALAYAAGKPVFAVNTLDAIAANAQDKAAVCAIMDARRGEVYAKVQCGSDVLIEESARPLMELLEELPARKDIVFAGDAAVKYREEILRKRPDSLFLQPQFSVQRASSACMCVVRGRARKVAHNALKPHYLRESQAERVRKNAGG